MDKRDLSHDNASNAELIGWTGARPEVIAKVLNAALAAQDLSGFAALLSDIARDRGLKGARAGHQSIYDMPYASLLPRQKHMLADAFELFILLGLEFRARAAEDNGDEIDEIDEIDETDEVDEEDDPVD